MSNIWICVISCVWLAGRLASRLASLLLSIRPYCLAWQKLDCWTLHANFSTKFFHTCHAYRHHWPEPFYTTFSDLNLGVRVTRSAQSKTSCLHFLPHFSTEWDEIWYGYETIQAEHPNNSRREILRINGNNYCFLLHQKSKTFPCIQTFTNRFGSNWDSDRSYYTLHFDSCLCDQGHWDARKEKTSVPIISQGYK